MINKELEIYLQSFVMDQLMQSEFGEKIEQATRIFEEVQNHLYALSKKHEEAGTTIIKIGTVLTFALLRKIADGKMPDKFDKRDWKEIVNSVSQYAIIQDEQSYTKFVFCMYESYIRSSANYITGYVSDDTVQAIHQLADELAEKTMHLDNGEITEVRYIEDCLWISLDAMIKLLAATALRFGDKDARELAQAFAMYAFEYGRFKLLQKENELLDQYIQAQHVLDEELEKKYSSYMESLKNEANQFCVLIENAFTPNFRETFLYSIALAQAAGVKGEEILTSIDDIDAFFLD